LKFDWFPKGEIESGTTGFKCVQGRINLLKLLDKWIIILFSLRNANNKARIDADIRVSGEVWQEHFFTVGSDIGDKLEFIEGPYQYMEIEGAMDPIINSFEIKTIVIEEYEIAREKACGKIFEL
jgi:hypothetical protein